MTPNWKFDILEVLSRNPETQCVAALLRNSSPKGVIITSEQAKSITMDLVMAGYKAEKIDDDVMGYWKGNYSHCLSVGLDSDGRQYAMFTLWTM